MAHSEKADARGARAQAQTPIRVLIADDHGVVREGLVAMIGRQEEMAVVAQAANGAEAVELWRSHRPDITLLDLRMPVLDGVGAIGQIRAEDPKARILILTTYDGDEDIYRCLEAGAAAYLLKDSLHSDLLDIIRRVHAGEHYLPEPVAARLAEHMSRGKLTPRELEILEMIAKGMSNREIAAKLSIAEATINVHVSNITTKLGVSNRTQVIIAAHKRGIIHIE
jgi:two-component system NarL family response regulator